MVRQMVISAKEKSNRREQWRGGGNLRRGWEGRLPERGYLTDQKGGRVQSGQPGPELPGGRCRLQRRNRTRGAVPGVEVVEGEQEGAGGSGPPAPQMPGSGLYE